MTMRKRPQTLLLAAVALISYGGCTRIVRVPAPVPAAECPLGPLPDFPDLSDPPPSCPSALVCLTDADAGAIWLWARGTRRWAELAVACIDARS